MRLLSAALILTISAVACTARAAPQQVEIAYSYLFSAVSMTSVVLLTT